MPPTRQSPLDVARACLKGGARFRNCEMYTVRGGKLAASEVYFGWDLPHKAPAGQHRE